MYPPYELRQIVLMRFSKISSVSGRHCTDVGIVTRPGAVGKRANREIGDPEETRRTSW